MKGEEKRTRRITRWTGCSLVVSAASTEALDTLPIAAESLNLSRKKKTKKTGDEEAEAAQQQ
jgi:hypothetical protein